MKPQLLINFPGQTKGIEPQAEPLVSWRRAPAEGLGQGSSHLPCAPPVWPVVQRVVEDLGQKLQTIPS